MRTIGFDEASYVFGGAESIGEADGGGRGLGREVIMALIAEGIYKTGSHFFELVGVVVTKVSEGGTLVVCPNIMGDPDYSACQP